MDITMISRMNDRLPSVAMSLISHRYRVCMCKLVACKRPIIIRNWSARITQMAFEMNVKKIQTTNYNNHLDSSEMYSLGTDKKGLAWKGRFFPLRWRRSRDKTTYVVFDNLPEHFYIPLRYSIITHLNL